MAAGHSDMLDDNISSQIDEIAKKVTQYWSYCFRQWRPYEERWEIETSVLLVSNIQEK